MTWPNTSVHKKQNKAKSSAPLKSLNE